MKIVTKMLCLQFKMSVWVAVSVFLWLFVFSLGERGSFTAAAYIYVAM